jgi:3',5'-nucleoside bisphosphate phosphatase
MGSIDLHSHTTASDGLCSSAELVRHAADRDVAVLAVTDHDTVAGVPAATEAGRELGVRVVAGIELGAESDGRSVHILGLFLDQGSPELLTTLRALVTERVDRARAMVERLRALGHDITFGDVLRHAGGEVIARPHVARALIDAGSIAKVHEAFTPELIADGGLAYVPRRTLSPRDAIALIGRAGGVAVVAHPGVGHHTGEAAQGSEALIRRLASDGLTGVEVDHPDHDPILRDRLRELAAELGLIATGGSDFHHMDGPWLGTCTTSEAAFEALEARRPGA